MVFYFEKDKTPQEIRQLLTDLYHNKTRVRFHWGDTETGKDWGETYDVKGTVGQSTGSQKIPLLINNARSMGGRAILCNSIVKVTETVKPHRVLYQHPSYHV